jgi:hypothetical protein
MLLGALVANASIGEKKQDTKTNDKHFLKIDFIFPPLKVLLHARQPHKDLNFAARKVCLKKLHKAGETN